MSQMMTLPWVGRERFENLTEQYADAIRDLGLAKKQIMDLTTEHTRATAERNRAAGELAQVRAALSEVSVYEGLADVSPVAMMVSQLVTDHEELEARIDAVLMLLSDPALAHDNTMIEIARLLRGGKRLPDTIED